ncbi:MAG: AIR carboxylase family protein [Nanoarchaeota archaeon]|nr:AIR carboxylase family protein [DPANN group archaeon]MBL7116806.1 AIR carboxylase family protein [Nanoarchaeota archaeon]
MIDEVFKETMKSNTGCAVILAGSDSDKPHIDAVVKSLDKYGIPYEVRICSAHKQPDTLMEMINEYNDVGGLVAYVAIAGGTDALSGTLSFHALGPVISCPPDAPNESCLTNPPGSSNAYIAKPANVGKFIAQLYAGVNPRFKELLIQFNDKKVENLQGKDAEFKQEYQRR